MTNMSILHITNMLYILHLLKSPLGSQYHMILGEGYKAPLLQRKLLIPKMQARKMIEFEVQSKMLSCINIYNIQ